MAFLKSMKQANLELKLNAKKTRKREFTEQVECVVPWIPPAAPPFTLEIMLRTHFLPQ